MTVEQIKVVETWMDAGRRFQGFFISEDINVVVSVFDKPIEDDKPLPGLMRLKYGADGQLLNSGYYPIILTPNKQKC